MTKKREMKKSRRLRPALYAGPVIFLLAGCGGDDVSANKPTEEVLPPLQKVEMSEAAAKCAGEVESALAKEPAAEGDQEKIDALMDLALAIDDKCADAK